MKSLCILLAILIKSIYLLHLLKKILNCFIMGWDTEERRSCYKTRKSTELGFVSLHGGKVKKVVSQEQKEERIRMEMDTSGKAALQSVPPIPESTESFF